MDRKFYRVYSVKKNNKNEIIEVLCFETTNNLTIKPILFIKFSSEEVVEKINKEEGFFRVFYYNNEKYKFLNGSKLIVVNGILKTNKNKLQQDNLDNLPTF